MIGEAAEASHDEAFSSVVKTGLMTEGFSNPAASHAVTATSPNDIGRSWLVTAIRMRSGFWRP
jgi:hypothetical protein